MVEARQEGYAGDGEYIPDDIIPGFKRFRFEDTKRGFYYEDRHGISEKRPGNFAGFELVTRYPGGPRCAFYSYAGGLTKEGEKLGEEMVYGQLKRFLREHVEEVRFGETLAYAFADESGLWSYRSPGRRESWGWYDFEIIEHDVGAVYKLSGQGVCFLPTPNLQK